MEGREPSEERLSLPILSSPNPLHLPAMTLRRFGEHTEHAAIKNGATAGTHGPERPRWPSPGRVKAGNGHVVDIAPPSLQP